MTGFQLFLFAACIGGGVLFCLAAAAIFIVSEDWFECLAGLSMLALVTVSSALTVAAFIGGLVSFWGLL